MFILTSLLFACSSSDDSDADKQNLVPVEQPLSVGNVVVFPYTQLTSDSYLQCIPEIAGGDAASLVVNYVWLNVRTSETLSQQFDLQLTADMIEPGDDVVCQVTAVDYRNESDFGEKSVNVISKKRHIQNASIRFLGERASDLFGSAISDVGDVDGDGRSDFFVGAPYNSIHEIKGGKSYLFTSLGDTTTDPENSFYGERIKDYACGALSGGGDIDGDGLLDLIVGATGNDEAALDAGKAYVLLAENYAFREGDMPLSESDFVFRGEAPGDSFGSVILSGVDLDADVFGDFVIAAPNNDTGGFLSGAVYLYYGMEVNSGFDQPRKLVGEQARSQLGTSLIAADDHDNDGKDDFWVSAPGGNTDHSAIYLMQGRHLFPTNTALSDASVVIRSHIAGEAAGTSLATGDVDGDGEDDLLIGAPFAESNGYRSGKAYLVLAETYIEGGVFSLEDADIVFIGEMSDDNAGQAVSIISDASGDGLADILVASPGNSTQDTKAGKIHYIRSDDLVAGEWQLSDVHRGIYGSNSYDFAGEVLQSLGDYDEDGLGDFLIGMPHSNSVGTDSGQVVFVSGSWL